MLYSGKFDMKKTIKIIREYIEWFNNPEMHSLDDNSLTLLKSGFIYLLGRDN